ncbi:hypothetical protein F8M41_013178 [Gigaspora margarita]|uniref:Uncharacterized protein n=1 Tax=Gigaspora margarita TaxID=4874 RepID=A0A8H3WYY4_GIGMA|nr:hypothetical protein F8M41_013178 [Gigaspora margarita]
MPEKSPQENSLQKITRDQRKSTKIRQNTRGKSTRKFSKKNNERQEEIYKKFTKTPEESLQEHSLKKTLKTRGSLVYKKFAKRPKESP